MGVQMNVIIRNVKRLNITEPGSTGGIFLSRTDDQPPLNFVALYSDDDGYTNTTYVQSGNGGNVNLKAVYFVNFLNTNGTVVMRYDVDSAVFRDNIGGEITADFNNRFLYDPTSTLALDWENRILAADWRCDSQLTVDGTLRVQGNDGISATITTAKLTPVTGANGSMTFVGGILTAQTQAT